MVTDQEEIWLPISGFVGLYEVSNAGRVRSLPRVSLGRNRWGDMTRHFRGRILSSKPDGSGYLQVTLCDGKGGRTHAHVHRLVAAAFIGNQPAGLMTLHRDGVKTNCSFTNLYYGTAKQNTADAIAHGHLVRGEKSPRAKLTDTAVATIRRLKGRITNEKMAQMFGVSESAVAFVARGETWKHVGAPSDRATTKSEHANA